MIVSTAAKLTVEVFIDPGDAGSLRDAEKLLDDWLRDAEDDDRLISYRVARCDWTPRPS